MLRDYAGNSYAGIGDTTTWNFTTAPPPPPPTPAAPNLDAGSDTGISNTDNTTSDTTPTLSGTVSNSAIVYIYRSNPANTFVGSTTADGSGNYSITSPALSDGVYSFTAVQELLSVRSATSSALSVTIDTTSSALTITSPVDGSTTNTTWSPVIDWQDATSTCTYDIGGGPTSTVCSNNGSDIANPGVGTHTLVITGTDLSGNVSYATSTFTRIPLPAVISNISVATTSDTATITWDTDTATDSQVEYGLTSTYTASSTLSTATTTSHSVTLTGLTANTTYNFRVLSRDDYGQLSTSTDNTFVTDVAPVISNTTPAPVYTPGPTAVSAPTLSQAETLSIFADYLNPKATSTKPVAGCTTGNIFSIVTGQRCPVASVGSGTGANTNTPTSPQSFTRNLQVGSTGADVKQLQVFLNNNGFTVAISGGGSKGNETAYFGPATRSALARYQQANNIRPAIGYFGPVTRGIVGR